MESLKKVKFPAMSYSEYPCSIFSRMVRYFSSLARKVSSACWRSLKRSSTSPLIIAMASKRALKGWESMMGSFATPCLSQLINPMNSSKSSEYPLICSSVNILATGLTSFLAISILGLLLFSLSIIANASSKLFAVTIGKWTKGLLIEMTALESGFNPNTTEHLQATFWCSSFNLSIYIFRAFQEGLSSFSQLRMR